MEIAERRRRSQALTRPELAVLLAYAKLSLNHDLLRIERAGRSLSRRASSAAISRRRSCERFPDALAQHRLRREIIATQLANSMINRGGPSLVVRIADQTGAAPADDRGGLRGGARQLRHDRAQHRDRRARQQDPRQAAARALRGGAGPAARPPGLVPAQCRSDARAWRRSSRTIATASPRSRRRSTARSPRRPRPRARRATPS